jgi:flagellar export protein FliJ
MARFRFRAQAALDLRRRQFDEARRELADAERVRDQQRLKVERAAAALVAARGAGTASARRAGSITEWHWYRIWILRLEHERTAEQDVLRARETVVEERRIACLEARQRYESLERFREKALEAFDAAEAAAERKLVDELATRRFLVETRSSQGVSS